MAVKIRLTRIGRHKKPFYRIVVADSKYPRDGRFIEILGLYDPLMKPARVEIMEERAALWLKRGAKMTDTVRSILSERNAQKKTRQRSASTTQTET